LIINELSQNPVSLVSSVSHFRETKHASIISKIFPIFAV
jgi:hypothetical protein